ncbi:MAG: cysteine synthase A, partial [Gemmatimonadota bacterium]|nr:cysteine synthase A [Gemmatimonadota bacterium]
MSLVYDSILDLIGNTPLIRLDRMIQDGDAAILGKHESSNPGGSVKDRIAYNMILDAERTGRLKPGGTIVEPTSGNTGLGLSLVAAVRGYHVILTMPDNMSTERRGLLASYGAEIVLTPAPKGMAGAIEKAEDIIAENPDHFMPQQFKNPANPEIHHKATGPELWDSTEGNIHAFVAGVGTGGTITGVGRFLKEKNPDVKIIAVEPSSSAVLSGDPIDSLIHGIQGIGAGFIPDIVDNEVIDEIIKVNDEDAYFTAKRLGTDEGLLVGISAG